MWSTTGLHTLCLNVLKRFELRNKGHLCSRGKLEKKITKRKNQFKQK